MAGGYHTYNAGDVLTASVLDSFVRDQVVIQFATEAARDAAVTVPVEGMMCVTIDKDRIWTYNGAAWVRTGHYSSTGRTGFEVSRTGTVQAITNTTQTTVTFDTATIDNDSWHSGATFTFLTVPTGADGTYSISALLGWSVAAMSVEAVWLSISGTDYFIGGIGSALPVATANHVFGPSPIPLVAAQQFGIKVWQTSGGSNNLNITMRGIRLGF